MSRLLDLEFQGVNTDRPNTVRGTYVNREEGKKEIHEKLEKRLSKREQREAKYAFSFGSYYSSFVNHNHYVYCERVSELQ